MELDSGAANDQQDAPLQERHGQGQVWFLESLDQVNRAIQGTNDLDQMMRDVLDAVLHVYTIGQDGDTINLYYGAADTNVALARGSVKRLLQWLDEHGAPESMAHSR
jgi:hypothetical protein